MDEGLVAIGWGDIAKLICKFPNVIGHLKPYDVSTIVNGESNEVIGPTIPGMHLGVMAIAHAEYKRVWAEKWWGRNLKMGRLIHPQACIIDPDRLGLGCVAMPVAFVDGDSLVGQCTIIGPQVAIRVAEVGEFSHLAIGASILQRAKVGNNTFIGANAVVLQERKVGHWCAVAANSTLTCDLEDEHRYIGKSGKVLVDPIEHGYPQTRERKDQEV